MGGPERADPRTLTFTRLIDLGVGLAHEAPYEPFKPSIRYDAHEVEGLAFMQATFGATAADLTRSGGRGPAAEVVTATTHAGTHVDAPWHYAPTSEGAPAKTIDQLPLEWFFSDGVVLDLRAKRPGDKILVEDLERALAAIAYTPKPLDIVLLMTSSGRRTSRASSASTARSRSSRTSTRSRGRRASRSRAFRSRCRGAAPAGAAPWLLSEPPSRARRRASSAVRQAGAVAAPG